MKIDKLEWTETIGGLYVDTVIGRFFIDHTPIGFYLTTSTCEIGLYETEHTAKCVCQRFYNIELKRYNKDIEEQ